MPYRIEIPRSAAKELAAIAEPHRANLKAAILALADSPRPNGCKKLKGLDDVYRIRVGDYRVSYQIRDKTLIVIVVKVGHRREVYR
jgi:mRNA interferase RelE/StbE